MQEKTVSTTEIAKAIGKDQSTVRRRSEKEEWESLVSEKGKRKKFIYEKLPEDVKQALLNNQENIPDEASHASPETSPSITEADGPEITETKDTPENIPQAVPAQSEGNQNPPEASNDSVSMAVQDQKKKEVDELLLRAERKSLILLGKNGIGKTYTLELLSQELSKKQKVIFFKETPTAKTILANITIATNIKPGSSKEETFRNLEDYQGEKVALCIDQLENITPSSVAVLDKLMSGYPWFRFIGAGHLGGKKKHNPTWMKAQAYFLRAMSRYDSMKLIEQIWPTGDITHKKIIVDESRGIPGNIVRMAKEAQQGIMPQEEQRYLDATPIILIIATIGLAIRVIGYGYQATENYIMGGVIGTIFWGLFWIYRGYIQGWWGSRKPSHSKKQASH